MMLQGKKKKRVKKLFHDDEANEEDMDDGSDNDSIALDELPKKTHFKNICENPDLLSENSSTSDIFKLDPVRGDMETPTITLPTLMSAPSSASSFGTTTMP